MRKKEDKRFRLRNMNVTRVDLVDRGANQDAHIMIAKNEQLGYPPKSGSGGSGSALADRLSAMANKDKKSNGSPLGRDKGEKKRILRLSPTDFEVVSTDKNIIEWAIPEDKLPEGVEEAMMTMAVSGETQMFQWMIDPLAGPPVEGQAKSAPEAFMAMRAALTNAGSLDPSEMLGGMPSGKPGQSNGPGGGNQQESKPLGVAKQARIAKQVAAATPQPHNPVVTVEEVLDIITKGLVEVDVFAETATGEDLGDILPKDSLDTLTSKLSAESAE